MCIRLIRVLFPVRLTMGAVDPRLRENVDRLRERIQSACQRCGRNRDAVRLVAVTKSADVEWVRQLPPLGIRVFGESRPQQLVARAGQLRGDVEWHLVGHLQRNKVRPVLPIARLIHSVDSPRLLQRIDETAVELGLAPRVLLEVNVSGEASKQGLAPQDVAGCLPPRLELARTSIDGLMTMAPLCDHPEEARPVFRALRKLRDDLAVRHGEALQLTELSMGMSQDFEVAVEEGATLVRIGSLLFEGLRDE